MCLINVKPYIANTFKEKRWKIDATRWTYQSGLTLSQKQSIEAVGTAHN